MTQGQLELSDRLSRIEALLLTLDERTQRIVLAQAEKTQRIENMEGRLERMEQRQISIEDRERRMLFLAIAILLGVVIYTMTGEVVIPGA